ncbi:transmembrane protein 56 [Microcaecilia unicolor]|uniref:Transmembrane protein 56-like n=1 Tax=Microcaecilia unicolor TaxID=1415580 RepID=A0A6P7XQA5_9AMPH|nr:transmembrane protein 56-like [Microcaecilia unicolor]XP_030052835.1 transmembrane protein 56-like [Microcaecilia unicolor]XP_030052836.1 transmembrane protein 56-like [Microcaecilia unicolor]
MAAQEMDDSTRISYSVVAGSFMVFQFLFSAVSPHLSSSFSQRYRELPAGKKCEWDSRCVSTSHALIVGSFCLYILAFDEKVNADPVWGDPRLVKMNVAITCGYLLYDILLLARYWKLMGDAYFICHHLAVLYAYGYVLNRGVLPYFANFRLISELSTPFVNQRWFFDATGQPRSSWPVLLNGFAMVTVFFLVRIAVIPRYYGEVFATFGTEAFEKLGRGPQVAWIISSVVLDILNFLWMYKILRGFYRVLSRASWKKAQTRHAD